MHVFKEHINALLRSRQEPCHNIKIYAENTFNAAILAVLYFVCRYLILDRNQIFTFDQTN